MTHECKPHPLNVAGDFYVLNGCCTLCDVPRTEAPELFVLTDCEDHCYVKREPQNDNELDQMLSAIACAELQCIHYRGNDPAIISRLSAMGEMDVCDTSPPNGIELGLRVHATFATNQSTDLSVLASSFKAYVKAQHGKYSRISFPCQIPGPTTVKYKRNDSGWRIVQFDQQGNLAHVSHDSCDDTSVSSYISHWLATLDGVTDIRWPQPSEFSRYPSSSTRRHREPLPAKKPKATLFHFNYCVRDGNLSDSSYTFFLPLFDFPNSVLGH